MAAMDTCLNLCTTLQYQQSRGQWYWEPWLWLLQHVKCSKIYPGVKRGLSRVTWHLLEFRNLCRNVFSKGCLCLCLCLLYVCHHLSLSPTSVTRSLFRGRNRRSGVECRTRLLSVVCCATPVIMMYAVTCFGSVTRFLEGLSPVTVTSFRDYYLNAEIDVREWNAGPVYLSFVPPVFRNRDRSTENTERELRMQKGN
jgi:hypothetical protein